MARSSATKKNQNEKVKELLIPSRKSNINYSKHLENQRKNGEKKHKTQEKRKTHAKKIKVREEIASFLCPSDACLKQSLSSYLLRLFSTLLTSSIALVEGNYDYLDLIVLAGIRTGGLSSSCKFECCVLGSKV